MAAPTSGAKASSRSTARSSPGRRPSTRGPICPWERAADGKGRPWTGWTSPSTPFSCPEGAKTWTARTHMGLNGIAIRQNTAGYDHTKIRLDLSLAVPSIDVSQSSRAKLASARIVLEGPEKERLEPLST